MSKLDKNIKKEILSWIFLILGSVLLALFINNFIIVNAKVPTCSMENTIMTNDRIVALRNYYKFKEPKRFDIIVFKNPDNESILYVKRIIGLPKDSIQVINGNVYINGKINEKANSFVKETPIGTTEVYNVPESHYFVMGDNRNRSEDSRFWENTYVSRKKILGRVIFKYYRNFKIFNKNL